MSEGVRLDKWLWAARFFRTRSLAKQAIEAGHVRCEGERAKVSKEIRIGATLVVRQGWDETEVKVQGLSEKRGGAPEARLLYAETAESIVRREQAALQRKAAAEMTTEGKPSKKQRRMLDHFKRQHSWD